MAACRREEAHPIFQKICVSRVCSVSEEEEEVICLLNCSNLLPYLQCSTNDMLRTVNDPFSALVGSMSNFSVSPSLSDVYVLFGCCCH